MAPAVRQSQAQQKRIFESVTVAIGDICEPQHMSELKLWGARLRQGDQPGVSAPRFMFRRSGPCQLADTCYVRLTAAGDPSGEHHFGDGFSFGSWSTNETWRGF